LDVQNAKQLYNGLATLIEVHGRVKGLQPDISSLVPSLTMSTSSVTVRSVFYGSRYFRVFLVALLCPALHWPVASAYASQPLNVVVTLPVLKDWAQQIGGPHVSVTSLMTGYENEHTYSPKPSDLVAVRKAQVLIEVGAGLEVWVSTLVKNAGNPRLLIVTASRGIDLLEDHGDAAGMPAGAGSPHSHGNPHVWLDPDGASVMVRHIADAFIATDPAHREQYEGNAVAYLTQLRQTSEALRLRLETVSDRRIVVHHPAWPYFARYFGFIIAGTLLTQPGAEPSARRIQAMVVTIKQAGIRVIVSEAQLNQKLPQMLSRETGAHIVVLTTLPGALPGTETYLDMLRYNVLQLADALERPTERRSHP
jgi:zinc/manganese transport system substrate-binding protein/zinc transport system substrate-binding protein/manganese/iron transport system substrate-binding protein